LGSMFRLLLQDQPDRPLPDFRGILRPSIHDSILSRIGVSGKPGAVQIADLQRA
jgi:hypothetical protein